MNAEQVQMNVCGQETEPNAQTARTSPRWRSSSAWLLACCGGGALPIVAVLAWGYWEFGSLANTLAYLNGERLLVDPESLSFGTGRRGEERDLHFAIRNWTGKDVEVLGAKSTCGCMAAVAWLWRRGFRFQLRTETNGSSPSIFGSPAAIPRSRKGSIFIRTTERSP